MTDSKISITPQPVTDPERTHRVHITTTAGVMVTRAMNEEDAAILAGTIRYNAPAGRIIEVPFAEGYRPLATAHAVTWRVIENVVPSQP